MNHEGIFNGGDRMAKEMYAKMESRMDTAYGDTRGGEYSARNMMPARTEQSDGHSKAHEPRGLASERGY